MESIFAEIRTDYEDENGVIHLDGYKTDDDNEEGTIIGFFIKGEIYYRDPELQFDSMVKEVVDKLKKDYKKSSTELREEISKAVTSVVYSADAKPRPEFTNGSPLSVKLSLIKDGVDKIIGLL